MYGTSAQYFSFWGLWCRSVACYFQQVLKYEEYDFSVGHLCSSKRDIGFS